MLCLRLSSHWHRRIIATEQRACNGTLLRKHAASHQRQMRNVCTDLELTFWCSALLSVWISSSVLKAFDSHNPRKPCPRRVFGWHYPRRTDLTTRGGYNYPDNRTYTAILNLLWKLGVQLTILFIVDSSDHFRKRLIVRSIRWWEIRWLLANSHNFKYSPLTVLEN